MNKNRIFWKYLLNCFILIHLISSFTQAKEYKRGYVITIQRDTIFGQIKSQSDLKVSFEIEFKSNIESDSTIVFTPDSIREFCFLDDQIIYNSVQYWYYEENKRIFDKRFAKQIYSDNYTLFKLNIPREETYYEFESPKLYAYVLKLDTSYYTLSQREIIIKKEGDPMYISESSIVLAGQQFRPVKTYTTLKKDYVGTLKYILKDCPKGLRDVEKLDFYDKAVISFLIKHKDCLN